MSLGQIGFSLIQSLTGNPLMDYAMIFSSEYLVLLVPLTLVYLWFQGSRGKEDSVFGATAVLLGIASTYFLGLFYFHEPPQFQGFETILTKEMENAFPSQHTATVFSLVWPLVYQERNRLAGLVLVAGALTGFGRVYTGLHFPIDIIGGVASSLLAFGIVYLAEPWIKQVSGRMEEVWEKLLAVFEK